MKIKQMLHAIKVGIRSRLFICLVVIAACYCFSFSHGLNLRLAFGMAVLITSEIMIMLWGNSFLKLIVLPFGKRNSISWEDRPEFAIFKALAASQDVQLNKKKPFGVRKNFNNAYANPLTRQIIIGDLLIKKLGDGHLVALMGHEMTHIKRNHHLKMMFWTFLVPTLIATPLWIIRSPDIMYQIVFYATFFIVFLLISWHNEYDADLGSAKIAGFKNTIALLRKIVPRRQWRHESETHPSIHNRILKLRKHYQ